MVFFELWLISEGSLFADLELIVKEDKYQCLCASAVFAGADGVFKPRVVDSPLLHCFVLVHVDGGDGVLGAGLHLPVHFPLGVLRLGLQQVHAFFCFDSAGNGKRERKKTSQLYWGGDL